LSLRHYEKHQDGGSAMSSFPLIWSVKAQGPKLFSMSWSMATWLGASGKWQVGDIVGAGLITFGDEGVLQEQLFYV
jgi:hypothetical protein